ncbi:tryptophan synthase subunit alpha [Helicobacter mustelae]|uniref:Tryptophan synthase alpha chain n=1 Tax=Helicobacter mustelae (strain ATCC 43772 / CCUG 25715 / CIP 103759 / LMG 18044 / NCTC 12198 / R85-136P) TaxID=679897 RepID=D3UH64_HELM1|nr:tryptophan synthase subunit alpha [Helicobacter mustelae]CBG39836.1 tryptophan synthase alpha subunit [Helicobacter mustelae 12198]SQH71345.1 tryptophan synthase subunit alpha [Helicobacter mustelae]
MNIALMGHIIGGYPSQAQSIESALGIIEGGAQYLEVQFPFSDPSADGEIIEHACNLALQNGFKVQQGFEIIEALSKKAQILIMTYANIIFRYGIEGFLKQAKRSGAKALIIPDLPLHQDEGLRAHAKKMGIFVIELITPNMSDARMKEITQQSNCPYLYAVARLGITGSKTTIDDALERYIARIRKNSNQKIALGFGIQTHEQIEQIKDSVDIIVAGSYFVRQIKQNPTKQALYLHTKKLLEG